MLPGFCVASGMPGWLVMLLAWTGLLALVVWAITWLFPGRPRSARPTRPQVRQSEHSASPFGSGRR